MDGKDALDSSIRYLKGVGEQRSKLFQKLGIVTLRDLVGFFPRKYSDRTLVKPINSLTAGETVCVRALAADTPRLSHIRKGLDLVKLRAVDDTGSLEITYFNAPYIKDAIKRGETYIFYGKISGTLLHPEMVNPVFERDSEGAHGETLAIVPVYPLTAKLTRKAVAAAVRNALEKCGDMLPDVLTGEIVTEHKLCRARYAYFNIHFPESFKDLDIARRRLIFEELFVLTAAMKLMRQKRGRQAGAALCLPDTGEFYKVLPYKPTGAQTKAIDDALRDMSSGTLMNRLIQGDVGSGKTLVAAACAWAVWHAGAQTAFMAPTEILAKQHMSSLSELLGPLGMRTGLLTGSMTAKNKREMHEKLHCGEIDLIIGTHALLSEGVSYKNLGLVITDEQHRFGVSQRLTLAEKGHSPHFGRTGGHSPHFERTGGHSPHILCMSATPIPRTLALIIYGDLSISVIDEMPPGRSGIETHIIGEAHRERAYGFIRKLVGEGRQVYIICPLVNAPEEEDDDEDGSTFSAGDYEISAAQVKSAKEYFKTLSENVFPDLRVALVHGKMPAKQKDAAMADFASGKADILVATTVIEVGVDVPNAALMLIENADRYGLSQLHQLRGRVGRGKHKSYCILVRTKPSERLQIMKSTDDGFKIAEEDLKLRGPGDFFGSRQHGLPRMRIANLMTDMLVLHEAQRAAEDVLSRDPQLSLPEHKALAEEIERMFDGVSLE